MANHFFAKPIRHLDKMMNRQAGRQAGRPNGPTQVKRPQGESSRGRNLTPGGQKETRVDTILDREIHNSALNKLKTRNVQKVEERLLCLLEN